MTKHRETTTVEATVAHLAHLALLGGVKARVAGLFGRRESRGSFWDLVTGLLMNLPAASCWTITGAVGHRGPHRLQHLLSRAVWDGEAVLDRVARWIAARLSGPVIFAVDETGDVKSSTDAAGAASQYCGALGGVGVCQVAVHLSLVTRPGML
jgi:SRSO17 transposase